MGNLMFGFLGLLIAGLSISETNASVSEWQLFSDESDGVAFNYPKTWIAEQQRTSAFRVKVGDPTGHGSCALGTAKLPPQYAGLSAKDIINQTSKQDILNGARQSGVETTILYFKRIIVGNRPAIHYESHGVYQSMNAKVQLRTVSVMTVAGDRLYTLMCASNPEDMRMNRERYKRVLSSLTIRF